MSLALASRQQIHNMDSLIEQETLAARRAFSNESPAKQHGNERWAPHGFNLWLALFLGAMFVSQLLLIPSVFNPIRTPLRVAMFASSLGMLLIVPGKIRWTIATNLGALITTLFCAQLLNPLNNSLLASVASICLNFAILSPIFWTSKLKLRSGNLLFLFFALWLFNSVSSLIGILEVYYPATFARDSKISVSLLGDFADGMKVTLADGTSIYRPMGLTDTPGGAAGSGYLVIMLATCMLLQPRRALFKIVLFASIVAGLFCIYICQVRSILILAGIGAIVVVAILAARGQLFRAYELLVVFPLIAVGATIWAFSIGGDQVSSRISTLAEGSAASVYYSNRGTFLEDTVFRLLPEYPFGAGLGRWGMIHQYFGDKGSAALPPLWVEIQPTGWLFDGGSPLLLVYYGGLAICALQTFRVATRKHGEIADIATVIFAYNIATIANTLSYAPFIGQAGLTFWLINGCFFATIANERRLRAVSRKHPYPAAVYAS
jgi:hypothetical protein